jgi:hypothetical protein
MLDHAQGLLPLSRDIFYLLLDDKLVNHSGEKYFLY